MPPLIIPLSSSFRPLAQPKKHQIQLGAELLIASGIYSYLVENFMRRRCVRQIYLDTKLYPGKI